ERPRRGRQSPAPSPARGARGAARHRLRRHPHRPRGRKSARPRHRLARAARRARAGGRAPPRGTGHAPGPARSHLASRRSSAIQCMARRPRARLRRAGAFAKGGHCHPKGAVPMLRLPCAALALLAVAGCAALSGEPSIPPGELSEATLKEVTRTLSLDEFEGRAPGTPGEEKTLAYLVEQFERARLQPGNNGSWFQDVPLVEITASNHEPLTVAGKRYAIGQDWVGVSYREVERIDLDDSEIVFVGYGVVAPEKDWN